MVLKILPFARNFRFSERTTFFWRNGVFGDFSIHSKLILQRRNCPTKRQHYSTTWRDIFYITQFGCFHRSCLSFPFRNSGLPLLQAFQKTKSFPWHLSKIAARSSQFSFFGQRLLATKCNEIPAKCHEIFLTAFFFAKNGVLYKNDLILSLLEQRWKNTTWKM